MGCDKSVKRSVPPVTSSPEALPSARACLPPLSVTVMLSRPNCTSPAASMTGGIGRTHCTVTPLAAARPDSARSCGAWPSGRARSKRHSPSCATPASIFSTIHLRGLGATPSGQSVGISAKATWSSARSPATFHSAAPRLILAAAVMVVGGAPERGEGSTSRSASSRKACSVPLASISASVISRPWPRPSRNPLNGACSRAWSSRGPAAVSPRVRPSRAPRNCPARASRPTSARHSSASPSGQRLAIWVTSKLARAVSASPRQRPSSRQVLPCAVR